MLRGKLPNGRCNVGSRDNEEVCGGSGRAIMESDQLLILIDNIETLVSGNITEDT